MDRKSLQEGEGDNEEEITELMTVLETHKAKCIDQGNYMEADVAHRRLQELRKHCIVKHKQSIRSGQIKQRLSVEERHMLEQKGFNNRWDKKEEHQRGASERKLNELKNRQAGELNEMRRKEITRLERSKPKFSKELLKDRHTEKELAKQNRFYEADQIRRRADEQERKELNDMRREAAARILRLEKQLKEKQAQVYDVTKQKYDLAAAEMSKQRKQEFTRLLQKYQNMKTVVRSRHIRAQHQRAKFGSKKSNTGAFPRAVPRKRATKPKPETPQSPYQRRVMERVNKAGSSDTIGGEM